MAQTTRADATGATTSGNVILNGWTITYPRTIPANTVYPFVFHCQPNLGPTANLLQYGYHFVSPYAGKIISLGIVGISTPGQSTDGLVCQLIKNGTVTGPQINVSSNSAKIGVVVNLPFVAGDYWGVRYAAPVSGVGTTTASLLVQLNP